MATKLHIHIAHPAYHRPDRLQASMMNPSVASVLLVDTNPAIFMYYVFAGYQAKGRML